MYIIVFHLNECSHLVWKTTFGRWERLVHVDLAVRFIMTGLVDVTLPILSTWMTLMFLKCGTLCLYSLTGLTSVIILLNSSAYVAGDVTTLDCAIRLRIAKLWTSSDKTQSVEPISNPRLIVVQTVFKYRVARFRDLVVMISPVLILLPISLLSQWFSLGNQMAVSKPCLANT